jgi:alpha-N-arabinofuranosidase
MKRNPVLFIIAQLICTTLSAQNTVMVDASQAKDTINKNIYGHFAEHLGHCIYGGFYVGANNKKIPNRDGVRLDVIEALKKLKLMFCRYLPLERRNWPQEPTPVHAERMVGECKRR